MPFKVAYEEKLICIGCLEYFKKGEYVEYVDATTDIDHLVHSDCVEKATQILQNAPRCPKCDRTMDLKIDIMGLGWFCEYSGLTQYIKILVENKTSTYHGNKICCICNRKISYGADVKLLAGVWVHDACFEYGTLLLQNKERCPALIGISGGKHKHCGRQMDLYKTASGEIFWACKGKDEKGHLEDYLFNSGTAFVKLTKNQILPKWYEKRALPPYRDRPPTDLEISEIEPPKELWQSESKLESNIIEEPLEVFDHKYTLWLDPEFTQPYTFVRDGETIPAGGDNLLDVQATVDAIMAKTKVKVYIQTHA